MPSDVNNYNMGMCHVIVAPSLPNELAGNGMRFVFEGQVSLELYQEIYEYFSARGGENE